MHQQEANPMAEQINVLGLDIANLVLHIVGMEDTGPVVLHKRMARGALLPCIATRPSALRGMEACGRAHYWARHVREHGHEVRLMAPPCVNADVLSP
jgi:transposase